MTTHRSVVLPTIVLSVPRTPLQPIGALYLFFIFIFFFTPDIDTRKYKFRTLLINESEHRVPSCNAILLFSRFGSL